MTIADGNRPCGKPSVGAKPGFTLVTRMPGGASSWYSASENGEISVFTSSPPLAPAGVPPPPEVPDQRVVEPEELELDVDAD